MRTALAAVARFYFIVILPWLLVTSALKYRDMAILFFGYLFFAGLNLILVLQERRKHRGDPNARLTANFTLPFLLYLVLRTANLVTIEGDIFGMIFAAIGSVITGSIYCFFLVFIWNILSHFIRSGGTEKTPYAPTNTQPTSQTWAPPNSGKGLKAYPPLTDSSCVDGGLLIYGAPGHGLSQSGFSQQNIDMGVEGERRFVQEVKQYITRSPYKVALVNSIKFGGSIGKSEADVDHALIVGKAVYLIDAKCWGSGNYRLVESDTVKRDFNKYEDGVAVPSTEYRTVHMDAAMGKYATQLRSKGFLVPLAGIAIMKWSGSKGKQSVENSRRGMVYCGSPRYILDQVFEDARSRPAQDADPRLVKYMNSFRK